MDSRRKFLKQTGALALAGLVWPQLSHAESNSGSGRNWPFGLQLYTMGDLMVNDPKGTLKSLASIGFKELESAGSMKGNYYGFKPKELTGMIRDAGMHWRSAHVSGAPFSPEQIMKMAKTAEDSVRIQGFLARFKDMPKSANLKENYQQLADEAAEGGLSYLVCASIPVSTMDEIKTAVDVFSKAGEACKKNGVQFAYHNHTTEFDMVEGHRPFDYILSNTDKDQVKMELDLAWATKSGQDPVKLFAEHAGRFPLWHVKDLDSNSKEPIEIGNGFINFKPIFANAGKSGLKYFFIEQDGAKKPLESVTISYQNLKKVLS